MPLLASPPNSTALVRSPSVVEWPICRSLIPEAFRGAHSPDALLAFDAQDGMPAGCATFEWNDASVLHLRVRVIRNYRRAGIGAALIAAVTRLTAERGVTEIHARVNPLAEPDAEPFLAACGFAPRSRVHTVEAAKEPLFSHIARLRDRLRSSGKLPAGLQIATIADVPREPLARLYTTLIVPELRLPPGAAAPLVWDARFAQSPVLLVDSAIAGMLLIEANNGSGVCTVVARAVSPGHRGGWVNLLLMAEAFERGERAGSTRMRFEAPEDNADTMKLMARAEGRVVAIAAWYVRRVDAPEGR